ncbi:MAG: hypothetical protein AAFP86_00805 [Planctomycetota bacterium]
MRLPFPIASSLALLFLATPALAAQLDDFEGGANPNGWSFRVTTPDVVEAAGGNPDGWLHNALVDSFAPIVATGPAVPSAFTGDLRARGVTRIGVDAITLGASITAAGRDFTLLLRDTKGTPDPSDDDYAYALGGLVPQVGAGWSTYVFDVPSASTDAVPTGWEGGWAGDPENFRPGVTWSDVVTSVDVVEFWWLDPAFFALFQQWDVGIDNVFVETSGILTICSADVPNSTGSIGAIGAVGSVFVADNDVTLTASSMPPNVFGIFICGPEPSGLDLGFGTICVGGTIGRYDDPGQILSSGPSGAFSLQLDLASTPSTSGPVSIAAGESWSFQAWHRDAVPSGIPARFTNGIEISFADGSTVRRCHWTDEPNPLTTGS